jgi:hypothetical protein
MVGDGPTTSLEDSTTIVIQRSSYEPSTWLPAALLATLALLATALQAFGEEPSQLQWRPARKSAAPQAAQNVTRPNVAPSAHRHAVHHGATDPNAQPYAVVRVAYDDYGMAEGQASLKSVLVHPRDPQFEGTGPSYRTAQDQDPLDDDEITRGINEPFGAGQQPVVPDLGEELPEPTEPTVPETMVEPELPSTELPGTELPSDEELFNDRTPTAPDVTNQVPRTNPSSPNTRPTTPPSTTPEFREPPMPVRKDPPRTSPSVTTPPSTSPQPTATSPRARAKYEEEREKAMETCDAAREHVMADKITSIQLGINNSGEEGLDYPFECVLDNGDMYAGRHWDDVTYMWKAAANCHKPLYFEQVQLERYGHSWGPCVQPLVSGAHFFTRLPVLPYCMGITPPNECIYPLGYYRPGNCAPYMIPAVPFTWRAAAFQAGATVGTAAFLP